MKIVLAIGTQKKEMSFLNRKSSGKCTLLTMPPMKTLGNDVIMTRQMSPTVPATIHLRSIKIHHCVVFHQGPFAQGSIVIVLRSFAPRKVTPQKAFLRRFH